MVASPTAVFAAMASEKQNGRKVAAPTGRKHSQRVWRPLVQRLPSEVVYR